MEFTTYDVELVAVGEQKLQVIKLICKLSGWELPQAKAFVDGCPQVLMEDLKQEEAQALKEQFEALGATVKIKIC